MRMRSALAAMVLFGTSVATTAARSASIPITNASFETPAQSPMGTFASLTPPGWSIYDPDGISGDESVDFGVWWPTGFFDYAGGAQDGLQVGVVYVDLPTGTGVTGLRQTLPAVLTPNTRYSFEVWVGDPTDNSGAELAGFPGYRVELVAGEHAVVADDDTATQEGQLRPARATLPIGTVHPGLGAPLEIRLLNRNAAAGAEVDFDLVSVEATPAPIETYVFTVDHTGGSLAGVLVYDRERSAATQQFDRDASITITEATGDLAPFASIDFAGGFLSTSGIALSMSEPGGTGSFVLLRFGAAVSLDEPLPVESFPSNTSSVYLSSVEVVSQGESGAVFTITAPEPETGAAGVAVAALALLGAVRRR